MRKHETFILTPIASILKETQFALAPLESNINNYPLFDYVMQSLFLKMTGFQEQKLKCISWELATDDYALRYERYKQHPIGECSSYKDKGTVFGDLVSILEAIRSGCSLLPDSDRLQIITSTKNEIIDFCSQSPILGWAEKSLGEFKSLFEQCDKECVLYVKGDKVTEILGHCENCRKRSGINPCKLGKFKSLRYIFDIAIRHRNRCAHNISSYQQNLPALEELQKEEYVLENYLVRFAILMIIDKVFVALFKKYLEVKPEPFKL